MKLQCQKATIGLIKLTAATSTLESKTNQSLKLELEVKKRKTRDTSCEEMKWNSIDIIYAKNATSFRYETNLIITMFKNIARQVQDIARAMTSQY